MENHTGDPLLEESLETALEFELSRSRVVRVIPRVRIEDDLRLMKRSLDTRVSPETAREIAARHEGVDVVLTGSIVRAAKATSGGDAAGGRNAAALADVGVNGLSSVY